MERMLKKTKERIAMLYDNGKGISTSEISMLTGVPHDIVYARTKRADNLREKGYESGKEYQKHLAMQRTNPDTGKPYKSLTEYQKHLAMQRINPDTGNPYKSLREYKEHLTKTRAKRKKNMQFSGLILGRLANMRINRNDLAGMMKISVSTVYSYASGEIIPRGENMRKLLSALGIKELPKSLESLLE